MEKFSKIMKYKIGIEKSKYLYEGDFLKVKEKDGWEYVSENDCVIAIPHLLDFNEIMVRKEYVPPFQDKHPEQEFFLTMVSGTIEDGERPFDTLIRELQEEAGLLLNTTYMNYEKIGEYFFTKGNNSKCHIFYLPLRINDFTKVLASGDGSKSEEISSTVKVNTKYLESLKGSDLLTAYCIEIMKTKITL